MADRYILRKKKPVLAKNWGEWAKYLEYADRTVAIDVLPKDIRVSTVFLGLDHNFADEGLPILFETMVFRDGDGEECERYSTWDEAEEGHKRMVEMVMKED